MDALHSRSGVFYKERYHMKHFFRTAQLVASLGLLGSGLSFSQTASEERSQVTVAPVANVYVQTPKGVNVYNATAAGKLTPVSGSPFATSGQMEGVNGKYLFSVGTDYIHTYAITSNGAVGGQVSEIDTQSYGGSECGDTDGAGAILDHTGSYFYVQLWGTTNSATNPPCSATQTYKIASNGELTYLGDTVTDIGGRQGDFSMPILTISGNDKFEYGVYSSIYTDLYTPYMRGLNGVVEWNNTFTDVGPAQNPSSIDGQYFPLAVAADPSNHLAVAMNTPFGPSSAVQIASFIINNANGNIASTNTWANMPTLSIYPSGLSLSPSGKLLAVVSQGIQTFNFNGANPLTSAQSLLVPARNFYQPSWDNSNHLYVLDYTTGGLYVYTATPTSIAAASGSPYAIPNNGAQTFVRPLIVVPK
jgi:hypothetical protein